MSRTVSVFVRIDRTGHTVTLAVTGEVTDADQQELTRMTGRAHALFPDAVVTVDLGSTRASTPRDPEWENTNHRGDGEPEISNTPTTPLPPTAPSGP
jgi:hypothetical protein